MANELRRVSLASISVSALNSRKNLEAGTEDAGIEELAQSIKSNGLIQPPTLRQLVDGTYEVIAGQRRVSACQRLDLTEIDAFITDMDDDAAVGASLVENLQRADIHPLDKAHGLDGLVKRLGSEKAAASSTGLSVSTIRKYIRLLELPEDLRQRLGTADGPTGVGALSTLARNFDNPEEQREAWDLVHGFNSGTAEEILRRSGGNIDALQELREQALAGELNVHRCGPSLEECPWLAELPERLQEKVLTVLATDH